jgi:hypothetical protein
MTDQTPISLIPEYINETIKSRLIQRAKKLPQSIRPWSKQGPVKGPLSRFVTALFALQNSPPAIVSPNSLQAPAHAQIIGLTGGIGFGKVW